MDGNEWWEKYYRFGDKNEIEKAWEKFLQEGANVEDLLIIIAGSSIDHVLEEYKDKAWREILKQGISNDRLCRMINNSPNLREKDRERYWQQLLKQGPIKQNFFYLMKSDRVPQNYKQKAYEQLLVQDLDQDDFLSLVICAPSEHQDEAWEHFLERITGNDQIINVMTNTDVPERYKEKAYIYFFDQHPSNYELFEVIEKGADKYKAQAWEEFLKRKPSKEELNLVFAFAPEEYSKKAEAVLNKIKPVF